MCVILETANNFSVTKIIHNNIMYIQAQLVLAIDGMYDNKI